jgi:4-amino-4-deoxy-L-arabinose transferase-like glycosyltransferase
MSRVASWQQAHSVRDYATPNVRQLIEPPWAEFAILQLQVLIASDQLANFVQWLSMLGTLALVAWLAKLLGGSVRSQILAAVFAASLPMSVLQASSTQNDFVAAFWLAAFAVCVLLIGRHRPADWGLYLAAGASLGLAICTKGTIYFYAAPFVLLLVAQHLRPLYRADLARLGLVAAVALLLNLGPFIRNQAVFGSPLGPTEGYAVARLQWNGVVSNVVRNIALHLQTPSDAVDQAIVDGISYLHERIGIGMSSPITSWPGSEFRPGLLHVQLHEDSAGNLFGILLLAVSVALGWSSGIFGRDRRLLQYTLAWGLGFLLFCAALRWQPWSSRLHLPWFVLGGPIAAVVWDRSPLVRAWRGIGLLLLVCCLPLVLQRLSGASRAELLRLAIAGVLLLVGLLQLRRPRLRRHLGRGWSLTVGALGPVRSHAWLLLNVGLLVAAGPWLLVNQQRPLLGQNSVLQVSRLNQYFVNNRHIEASYLAVTAQLADAGCTEVGLQTGVDAWDYPLWLLVQRATAGRAKVEYVDVVNVSKRLSPPSDRPCAILSTRTRSSQPLILLNQDQADTRRQLPG